MTVIWNCRTDADLDVAARDAKPGDEIHLLGDRTFSLNSPSFPEGVTIVGSFDWRPTWVSRETT